MKATRYRYARVVLRFASLLALLLVASGSSSVSAMNRAPPTGGRVGSISLEYEATARDVFGHTAAEHLLLAMTVGKNGTGPVVGYVHYAGVSRVGDCPGLFLLTRGAGDVPDKEKGYVYLSFDDEGGKYTLDTLGMRFVGTEQYQVVTNDCGVETKSRISTVIEGAIIHSAIGNGRSSDKFLGGSYSPPGGCTHWPKPGVDTGNGTLTSCTERIDWALGLAVKTPEDVQQWTRDSAYWNHYAAGMCAFAGVVFFVPAGQGAAAVATVLCGLAWERSAELTDSALDPPDPHFRIVGRPKAPSVPRVAVGPGINRTAAVALNSLFTNESREIGLERVFVTSIERAQGAAKAKNLLWQKRQIRAARRYAARLAAVLRAQLRLLRASRVALGASQFPKIVVQISDVERLQAQVRTTGFSPETENVLRRLGASARDREEFRTIFTALDPSTVARTVPLPAALTNQASTKSTLALANRFGRFAKRK